MVLVQRLVLFVLFFPIDLGIFLPLGTQVRLSRVFGTDRTQRNHFLKIMIVTRRALRRR